MLVVLIFLVHPYTCRSESLLLFLEVDFKLLKLVCMLVMDYLEAIVLFLFGSIYSFSIHWNPWMKYPNGIHVDDLITFCYLLWFLFLCFMFYCLMWL